MSEALTEPFLTVNQAAEKTGIDARTLRRIVKNSMEELNARKHGRDWQIPSNSIGLIKKRGVGEHGPWKSEKAN